jgi:hypothetical protein
MRFATPCFVLLLSMMSALPALSWQEGEDQDSPLECSGLPLAGADRIVVRVRPEIGSFNLPKLVGLKDDNVLWTRSFPKAEEVNIAKFEVSCQATTIKLWSQYPGRSTATVQEFSWNGKRLQLKESSVENESATIIKNAISSIVAAGRVDYIDLWDLQIPYAHEEITEDLLIEALVSGQKSASLKYKDNNTAGAARTLATMFDFTAKLVFYSGGTSHVEEAPDKLELWLNAWQTKGIGVIQFVTALNDYGFYLQETGAHKEAMKIFEKIKEIDPTRLVNYLNLADSLWAVGQKEKACESYEMYSDLMHAKHIQKQVPLRVTERMKELR